MKTYILQKDIISPHRNIKKGSEFIRYCELNPDSAYMFDGYALDKSYIENNPEWFLPKKEDYPELILSTAKGEVELKDLIMFWEKFKPDIGMYTREEMQKCWETSRMPLGGIGEHFSGFNSFISALNQTK